MKKKQPDHSKHINKNDEEESKVDIYKKVIQTDLYDDKQKKQILDIVNGYIDVYNSQINDQNDNDGFTTVNTNKKQSRYDDYYKFKEKIYYDIQNTFQDSNEYTKKPLKYLRMELSNMQLNLILNFLSTVINMVDPVIYDDIKPVAEEVGANKYIIHIQYFPRCNSSQIMEQKLREDDKFKTAARAQSIRDGLIKNNFQDLDNISGFYEDFHIEFKNIYSLHEIKTIEQLDQQKNSPQFTENNTTLSEQTNEINGEMKNFNKQQKLIQSSPSNKNEKNGKLTYEECFSKFLYTIVAMMNTQGGSIFIPIKENQNPSEDKQQYTIGQIDISEQELKNKIRSCFQDIVFYKLNGEIEIQEKTEEILNRFLPEINILKDQEGNIRVYEVIIFQVYPEYLCNLQSNKTLSSAKTKNNNSKEENFEFPIRRSAANCTIVFSKEVMKNSLYKAQFYNSRKNQFDEENQKRLVFSKTIQNNKLSQI